MLRWITENSFAPELIAFFIGALQVELGNIGKGELHTLGSDGPIAITGTAVVLSAVFDLITMGWEISYWYGPEEAAIENESGV